MTDSAAIGRIGSGDLSVSERAMARAGGIPSRDEYDSVEYLARGRGRLRCGVDTTGFAQLAFYADDPGMFGNGSDGYAVTVTDGDWGGTGTPTLTFVGAFADWEWYPGAYVTITSTDGGFTSHVGETYEIASKDSDDTITLTGGASTINGVALPAGAAAGVVDFTVSARLYCPLFMPIPPPIDGAMSNNAPGFSGAPAQSKYWDYCFAELPPGGLTDGAKLTIELVGRINLENIAARPFSVGIIHVIVDPQGTPLVQDLRENEAAVGRVRPTIVGWVAPKTTAAGVPWATATTTERNSKVLVTLANHGLVSGDLIRPVSVKADAFGDILDPTADIENGQGYYVAQSDIDADVADDTSEFFLSKSDTTYAYIPVPYSGSSPGDDGEVAIVRYSRGSMKRQHFRLVFNSGDEYANPRYYRIRLIGVADGRTVDTDEGVTWSGDIEIYPYAERADVTDARHVGSISTANPPVLMGAVISRTSPGNTMNTSGSGSEDLTGAPLLKQKASYYLDDGVPVAFTGATWTEGTLTLSKAGLGTAATSNSSTRVRITGGDGTVGTYDIDSIGAPDDIVLTSSIGATATTADGWHKSDQEAFQCYETTMHDYGGAYDIVHIDEKPHDEGYLTIRVETAVWGGSTGTGLTQAWGVRKTGDPFAGFTYYPGAKLRVISSTSGLWEPGYYAIASKWDNKQVILDSSDPRLPTASASAELNCDIDDFPLVSYLGEDATGSQVNNYATLTKVERADGTEIGEILQHDNVLQRLWITPYNDEHAEYGETLTLKTYIRRKTNNTGSSWNWGWPFSSASWDPTTRRIFKVGAFKDYEFAAGDEITITGGSGWTAGDYEIESYESEDALIIVAGQTGMGASSITNLAGSLLKPIRTTDVTVGRVDLGPHPTRLSLRMAVSGPQNGDVELEVRAWSAKLERHRSR